MTQKLYVGNLPFSVTSDELRELFSQHTEVDSVNIVTDRETGRPRGFGFVELESIDGVIEALDGQEFKGRALAVNLARERGGGGSGRW